MDHRCLQSLNLIKHNETASTESSAMRNGVHRIDLYSIILDQRKSNYD